MVERACGDDVEAIPPRVDVAEVLLRDRATAYGLSGRSGDVSRRGRSSFVTSPYSSDEPIERMRVLGE